MSDVITVYRAGKETDALPEGTRLKCIRHGNDVWSAWGHDFKGKIFEVVMAPDSRGFKKWFKPEVPFTAFTDLPIKFQDDGESPIFFFGVFVEVTNGK